MDEPNTVLDAVRAAVTFLGGPGPVSRMRAQDGLRGTTPWAISKWMNEGVPGSNVLWLSERTGWRWSPHQLAPGMYPHPDDGLPAERRPASQEAAA